MAFDLGAIKARMGLDTGGFVSSLKSAETASMIFGDSIVNLVNNPLLGTVNILKNTVSGFASLVKETAEYNQQLKLWADRASVSTELLSTLAFEGRKLDLTVRDIADMMIELGVKTRDADLGSQGLTDTFNRLGVAITDQNGNLRNNEKLFYDVAQALANITNKTEQAAIADELLSDDGKKMLPILALKREEFDKLIKKAKRYGQVVSEEAAANSVEFAGTLKSVSFAMEGIQKTSATAYIKGFATVVDDADSSVVDLANSINGPLSDAMNNLGVLTGKIAQSDYLSYWLTGAAQLLELLAGIDGLLDKILGHGDYKDPDPSNSSIPGVWFLDKIGYGLGNLIWGDDTMTTEQARQQIINNRYGEDAARRNAARKLAAQQGSNGG